MGKSNFYENQAMNNTGDVLLAQPSSPTMHVSMQPSSSPWFRSSNLLPGLRSQLHGERRKDVVVFTKGSTSSTEVDDSDQLGLNLELSLGRSPGQSRRQNGKGNVICIPENMIASGRTEANGEGGQIERASQPETDNSYFESRKIGRTGEVHDSTHMQNLKFEDPVDESGKKETATGHELHQHQQDMVELERKRGLQAQRQEARKRRKILLGEKQQRRASKEAESSLQDRDSLSNTSQSRSSLFSVRKLDGSCSPNLKREMGDHLQGNQKLQASEGVQHWARDAAAAHCSKPSMEDSCEDGEGGRSCLSSSNGGHSDAYEEEDSNVEVDSENVVEASIKQKEAQSSSSDSDVTDVSLPVPFESTPLSYLPSSYPSLPIACPFPVPPVAFPSTPSLQMGFSFPPSMQFLTSPGQSGLTGITSPPLSNVFQLPLSSGLSPYHFPICEPPAFWFPVATPGPAPVFQLPGLSVPSKTAGDMDCKMKRSRGTTAAPTSEPSVTDLRPSQRISSLSNRNVQLFRQSNEKSDCPAFESKEKLPNRKQSGEITTLPTDSHVVQRHQHLLSTAEAVAQERGKSEYSFLCHPVDSNGVSGQSESEDGRGESSAIPEGEGGSVHSQKQRVSLGVSGVPVTSSDQEACHSQQDVDVRHDSRGTGSFPDLHWVSTTGQGPNGKAINGVMYICNRSQVRIVCTCHRNNMSPSEFVQHAGSTDLSNPERNIVVSPFPFPHRTASVQEEKL